MKSRKKLVLFDIDGTLIYHVGPRKWEEQYIYGMKIAYGITHEGDLLHYNGTIEVQAAWDVVRQHGIKREDFEKRFPEYIDAMHEHLKKWSLKGPVFRVIDDAKTLVQQLVKSDDVILGILTGNAERLATWKLEHTGLLRYFSFGLYGDAEENRVALAQTVFEKAKKTFHQEFIPQDIIVVGDTVHDIRCGKAIGAVTVAVTTGMHGFWDTLAAEKPDYLVQSLMDPKILSLFSLK